MQQANQEMQMGDQLFKQGEFRLAIVMYDQAEHSHLQALKIPQPYLTFADEFILQAQKIYYKRGKAHEANVQLDNALEDYKNAINKGYKKAKDCVDRINRKKVVPILWGLKMFENKNHLKIPRVLKHEILKKAEIDVPVYGKIDTIKHSSCNIF
ncbi:MAG: hypothetical protein HYX60_03290 [Legionella longbeachae]|nr:hypothetical protein [Legionella longbeachae]